MEEPEIQGWYSKENNKFEPNVTTIYSTKIERDAVFYWTLIPYENKIDEFVAGPISIGPLGSAFVVVNKKNETWELTIPCSNSKLADLKFKKDTR